MPGRARRSMADFLKEQQAIEDPLAGDPRPGLADIPGPAALPPQAAPVLSATPIPEPHSPAGHGELSPEEVTDLATCEAALDNLRMAFWAAGKALQVILDARLYRGTHGTFEDYLADRWDMSRAQAYRLIDAWPLAERLSPMGDKLNERQIRELLPVADRHGQDAAVTVYRAVAETDGVQVTAAVLHGAVSVLPADRFDPEEASRQIRSYLAGKLDAPAPASNPLESFAAETAKMLRTLQRTVKRGTLKAAASSDPDAVRKVIADLRAILDEIEHETAPGDG